MSKNKSLFELIHSLSTNEKRFFKIYASRHTIGEQNNYVKLFDLFDKIKQFDEANIQELAENSDFIKYFSAEKNYLYNLVLDCLDAYHKESSVDRQISKLINIGRVLLEKKLENQSTELLEKAQKLSVYHNRIEHLLPINTLLKWKDISKESITSELLNAYHETEYKMLQQLNIKLYYLHTFDKLLLKRRLQGIVSKQSELQEIQNQFPYLVEEIPYEFESFDIEVYYLLSRIEYCRISRETEIARILAKRLIDLFELNRPKIAGEYVDRYIYVLYIFVVQRLYINEAESNLALAKLRRLELYIDGKVRKSEHAHCFEFYYTAITDSIIQSKSYHKIHEQVPEINRGFETYEQHMTPTFILALQFNIACIYFALADYETALTWLNKVRNETTIFRQDIFHDLRTLNLIIHLELGNNELLPNLIKSAEYYIKKDKMNSALQESLIHAVKRLIKAHERKQQQSIYKTLQIEFKTLSENAQENRLFHDVDLLAWIENKCQ